MRANHRLHWRTVAATAAVFLSATTLTLTTASSAQADPGCQNGGAYVLWARGSGAGFSAAEASQFKQHVFYALGAANVGPYGWAELGNLDGDNDPQDKLDPGEYPAVPVENWNAVNLVNGAYANSVSTGVDELILSLNHRYSLGPYGYNCTNETVILGGYSQGADVIGAALQRTGGISLTPEARNHIGFVALYGDPRMDAWDCPKAQWARANGACNSVGNLGRRQPYVPSDFSYRFASWCDQGDGVCDHRANAAVGNHGSVYRDWWIQQSAAEIVHVARTKRCQLNACATHQMLIAPDASIYAKTTIGMDGWTQEIGSGNANKIAAGGANQLLINGEAAVYGRTGIGTTWNQEVGPFNANAIAVSSTGVKMFIRGDAAIYAKQGSGNWVQEVGPGNATAIAVGGNTQMFIRGDAAIFARNNVGSGGWIQQVGPGNADKIAVSATGIQMFIRGDGAILAKRSLTDGWTPEMIPTNPSAKARAIAIGGETQAFIRQDGIVFAKTWVGDGGWNIQPLPDSATAKTIAVCDDGTIMVLSNNNAVFAKRGIASGWTQETGSNTANAISCG